MNFRVILEVIVILLLLISGLLVVLGLTGFQARSYNVLPSETQVTVNNESVPVSALAERYQPRMYLRSITPSPPLLFAWYSVVQNGSNLDVIYYHVWEDEVNPNKPFNSLYALFRAVYYGYPLRDIEYFQVTINPADGEVVSLFFETGLTKDFTNTLNEHILARVTRQADGSFIQTLSRKGSGELISSAAATPVFDDGHVLIGALTWNHLTILVNPAAQPEYDQLLAADLRFLSDEEFKAGRFVRKSQPDHVTRENPLILVISAVVIFFIVLIPFGVVRVVTGLTRKRKPDGDQSNG